MVMTDMLRPLSFQNLGPSEKKPFSSPFLRRLAARAASLGLGLWAACPPDSFFYNQGYIYCPVVPPLVDLLFDPSLPPPPPPLTLHMNAYKLSPGNSPRIWATI